MGYLVNDILEVSIFFNDREYPLEAINLLNSLHIGTSVRASVPTVSLQINDVQHIFDKIGLQDGTPIRVVIKALGKDTKTYNFRKFNHKRELNGATYVYTIHGYLNAPLFWNSTTAVGLEGNSNDVLSSIASTCSLKYDGIATSDAQLWMPANKSYRLWAKDVSEYGYVDNQSCMCLGLDLDATLRYKNVNALPEATKNVIAYQYSKTAFTAIDVAVNANSGFNNAVTGYQNMRYAQSSTDDEHSTKIDELVFKSDSLSPMYNNDLKTSLKRGPVRFGPISFGNVHDNYERASYQNTRYKNLFNMGLELLMSVPTDFKLMDKLNFAVQLEDTSQDSVNSGVYTVTGHSIYIQGTTYSEKLGIVRHGTNEQYKQGS